eukprot:12999596-Ditylum_brightwellii.AAC.1
MKLNLFSCLVFLHLSFNDAVDVHLDKGTRDGPDIKTFMVGDWFTGCPDGDENDDCSVGCQCKSGLHCETWSHVCRAHVQLYDNCHTTGPCDSGLSCHPLNQTCYNDPRLEGQPCVTCHECESGLHCKDVPQ